MPKAKLKNSKKLVEVFLKALEIAERIRSCTREYVGFELGISGRYIEPGASGSLTRGRIEVLPTGRNFYAINPTAIPTPAAWKLGVETAKNLIRYYLEKHGRYPESIGHWLWSLDGYKADGEQLSQILYLLGVKPKWRPDGSVKEIEVIPLDKLKRPRIDNVVRLSGIARDTLPNYIYLIDEAVSKVISLDEPPEMNYVKKHYLEHISKLVEIGKNVAEAQELASYRVFCSPPGTYGAGVNYAIEASAWSSDEDLAKTWIQWSGYVYSKRNFGKQAIESLTLNLSTVDIVTRNHVSDEHDIFNCCCYFSYHGGFFNTVKILTGRRDVEITVIDTKDISSPQVRNIKYEIERIVRAKLLNPVWIDEMKKHGYRGASEFSRKILHLYGWSATTKLVDDWVFNEIANTYILNDNMRRWFEENNVWAIEEINRRLIEAIERSLWKPSKDIFERLREAYGEIEGILEDSIGGGEVQGGTISVYTSSDDQRWLKNISNVEKVLKKLKMIQR